VIGRQFRFHGRSSIQRLYAKGKSVRSGALSLRFAPNPKRTNYRLAVVVSRKVSKSAVVRNRIRRRLYERVRILSSEFEVPHDLVITAYDAAIATESAKQLDAEVAKLVKKAKLMARTTGQHAIVEPKE
jgi:ribonuclease P protein component